MKVVPVCAVLLVAASSGCLLDRDGQFSGEPSGGGGATTADGGTGGGGAGGEGGAGGAVGGATTTGGAGGDGGDGGDGGSAGTEDCLDGIDNDANGLTDCEDPACQPGYECVPEAPSGWTGHRVETTAYPSASVQMCPDGGDPSTRWSTPGDPAICDACSCDAPMGATCSFPTLGSWVNSGSCSTTLDGTFNPGDANCYGFPDFYTCSGGCSNDQRVALLSDSQVTGTATCTASGGAATLPEPWQNQHNLCALGPTGGGCGTGSVCVARASAPFDQSLCVFQDGDQPCPAAFPTKAETFSTTNDTRACSACTCGAADTQCSAGSFTVYDDPVCGNGGSNPITVSGSDCPSVQNHMDNNTASYRATAGTLSGTCPPSGGAPTGTVTGDDAGTLCCQ